jgi:hypothetical protein
MRELVSRKLLTCPRQLFGAEMLDDPKRQNRLIRTGQLIAAGCLMVTMIYLVVVITKEYSQATGSTWRRFTQAYTGDVALLVRALGIGGCVLLFSEIVRRVTIRK